MVNPQELIQKVRRIEIKTRKLVNEMFAGEYHSVFKGQGIEFAEVREYQYGDDIRQIDWNVTARMGHPFIKRFEESREMVVMFVIDLSASVYFGSGEKFKNEIIAEICALLSFSAMKNNDQIGLLLLTDQIELYVNPRKGKKHVLRVVSELLQFQPSHKKTNLDQGFKFLSKSLKRKTLIFCFSDYFDEGYEDSLNILQKKHDVIGIQVNDPLEKTFFNQGLFALRDNESGEDVLIDTNDLAWQKLFSKEVSLRELKTKKIFSKYGLDYIQIQCDQDYVIPLREFFQSRERKIKR